MKAKPRGLLKPRVVQVSITDRCQCSCAHCGVSFLRASGRPGDPSLADIRRIFLDLKTFNCEMVDLFGGEPTLRKDLPEIVALGASMGFTMLLESNGLLLDRKYLLRLKKAGLGLVYLSLDSLDEAEHDRNRGHKGVFRAVVRAMNICRSIGVPAHVSTVPKGREFFTGGGMDRFTRFCVENGAEKVRVLFPSCVGNWSLKGCEPMSEKEEREVFRFVGARWRKYIYVEDLDNNKVLGGKTHCPAKSIFCHITTSGKVLPCPYLPMAFGDIRKESLLAIFSRIQGHPCMKEKGSYCPTRDMEFIKRRLSGLSRSRPCLEAEAGNLLRVEGGCNNGCRDCGRDPARVSAAKIAAAAVDPGYSELELYGGELFVRPDAFSILDALPGHFGLNIYSNARFFSYDGMAAKLAGYKVHAVKVPVFSMDAARFEAHTRVKGSYAQTLAGIRNLCRAGIPVSVFIPEGEVPADLGLLKKLGVVSVSSYRRAAGGGAGQVFCFGRGADRVKIVWLSGAGKKE